jgi:hypothetical protein
MRPRVRESRYRRPAPPLIRGLDGRGHAGKVLRWDGDPVAWREVSLGGHTDGSGDSGRPCHVPRASAGRCARTCLNPCPRNMPRPSINLCPRGRLAVSWAESPDLVQGARLAPGVTAPGGGLFSGLRPLSRLFPGLGGADTPCDAPGLAARSMVRGGAGVGRPGEPGGTRRPGRKALRAPYWSGSARWPSRWRWSRR